MSDSFFTDLDIPKPDFHLEVGSASHAVQTARIMTAFEPVVLQEKPDWVLVVGDVNSTIACALVCAKLGVKVAHVEAGLRSRDRTMPEEINRILTDAISDLLLTTSQDADENLKARRHRRQKNKICRQRDDRFAFLQSENRGRLEGQGRFEFNGKGLRGADAASPVEC